MKRSKMFKTSERELTKNTAEQTPDTVRSCRSHPSMLLSSTQQKKNRRRLYCWNRKLENASVNLFTLISTETHYYICRKGMFMFSLHISCSISVFPSILFWPELVCRPPLWHPGCVTSLWPSVACNNAQRGGEICLLGNAIISETLIWGPGM